MFFPSEQSLAKLDETLATHKSETDQEADEYAERYRHYRHGVDTICIVDLQQAQRERFAIPRDCDHVGSMLQANPSVFVPKVPER